MDLFVSFAFGELGFASRCQLAACFGIDSDETEAAAGNEGFNADLFVDSVRSLLSFSPRSSGSVVGLSKIAQAGGDACASPAEIAIEASATRQEPASCFELIL